MIKQAFMRAVEHVGYGPPETSLVLKHNIPVPHRVDGNSLSVLVHAISLNPIDCAMRHGYGRSLFHYSSPLPALASLGRDFSGVVLQTGSNVWNFKKGDEVYGAIHPLEGGTYADVIAVKQNNVALKPVNVTHEQAASFPYVALTTHHALQLTQPSFCNRDQSPTLALVHGGAGGIGSFAIQFLKSNDCLEYLQ